MAESRWSESQIRGSGRTRPNPVIRPIPTQPDHTATAAGAASRISGQVRIVRSRTAVAEDRSGPALTVAEPAALQRQGAAPAPSACLPLAVSPCGTQPAIDPPMPARARPAAGLLLLPLPRAHSP